MGGSERGRNGDAPLPFGDSPAPVSGVVQPFCELFHSKIGLILKRQPTNRGESYGGKFRRAGLPAGNHIRPVYGANRGGVTAHGTRYRSDTPKRRAFWCWEPGKRLWKLKTVRDSNRNSGDMRLRDCFINCPMNSIGCQRQAMD